MIELSKLAALRRVFPDHDRLTRTIVNRLGETYNEGPGRFNGRGYLLCITPRSGSSMLADVLGRTGSVGTAKEHFPNAPDVPAPQWILESATWNEVFRKLQAETASGYFGLKGDLLQMFPLISAGVFAGPGGSFRHIYLTRRDRIAQAISLSRAAKTHEWHSSDAAAPDPALSFEDVLAYLRYIRAMEADWETIFTALDVEPLRLFYEDVIADRSRAFERVRVHLGVEWKNDPANIVSIYQAISVRHDPNWIRRLRDEFRMSPAP